MISFASEPEFDFIGTVFHWSIHPILRNIDKELRNVNQYIKMRKISLLRNMHQILRNINQEFENIAQIPTSAQALLQLRLEFDRRRGVVEIFETAEDELRHPRWPRAIVL